MNTRRTSIIKNFKTAAFKSPMIIALGRCEISDKKLKNSVELIILYGGLYTKTKLKVIEFFLAVMARYSKSLKRESEMTHTRKKLCR